MIQNEMNAGNCRRYETSWDVRDGVCIYLKAVVSRLSFQRDIRVRTPPANLLFEFACADGHNAPGKVYSTNLAMQNPEGKFADSRLTHHSILWAPDFQAPIS